MPSLRRLLSPTILLSILALGTSVSARFENDFSSYPKGAQKCLSDADDNSGCDGDTVSLMNKCLCGDGGKFITNTAKCVGKESPGDAKSTYSTLKVNCDGSKTPLEVSEAEFMKQAGVSSTTSKPTSKPTTSSETKLTTVTTTDSSGQTITVTQSYTVPVTDPPTNAPTPGDNDEGLSTGAIVGIAVGASVLGIAAVAGVFLMFLRRRRNRGSEEARPMLGHNSHAMPPGGFGGHDSTYSHNSLSELGVYQPHQDWKNEAKQPGSPVWRPTSQSPGLAAPAQAQSQAPAAQAHAAQTQGQGWGGQHASWQQGWHTPPHQTQQPWSAEQYQVPPQGGAAQYGQQHPEVFELATSPAHTKPYPSQPPPIEMPVSHPGQIPTAYPGPAWGR